MKEAIFIKEMPVSAYNERIFDHTFVIEQWFKRVVATAIKLKYGSAWKDFFKGKDIGTFAKEINGPGEDHIAGCDRNNSIWSASVTDFARCIKNEEIRNIVEEFTGSDTGVIVENLILMKEFRKIIADQMKDTAEIYEKFEECCNVLDAEIDKFRYNILYQRYMYNGISCMNVGSIHPLSKYFCSIKSGGNESTTFIEESERWFMQIVRLPVHYLYIDIELLVKAFDEFSDEIIGILVNKNLDEFDILIPKEDAKLNLQRYESLVDRFFTANSNILTNKPYEFQNARYVCNPMIWFYDNANPFGSLH